MSSTPNIPAFRNDLAWASNFYPAPIMYEGIPFPTTEHFFHAMKSLDPAFWKIIAAKTTPAAAKFAGRSVKLRSDWDQVKIKIMASALRAKFQYPELRAKLLATGDQHLEESNYWHDNYWGNCYCPGCQSKSGQKVTPQTGKY